MKLILSFILATTLTTGIVHSATISSSNPGMQKTYDDIKKTLGIVPVFLKAVPEETLSAVWEEMKTVQLSANSVLTPKMKELIGLAVAAQIPCHYCTYFHTEAAKLNGASESEVKESVLMAGATRHWGTFVSGLQYKEEDFKKEVDQITAHMRDQLTKPKIDTISTAAAATARSTDVPTNGSKPASPASEAQAPIVDAQSAYADIEKTYGIVPRFIKMFPKNGIASAWRTLKAAELNPDSEIAPKYKELIGLAVAAQTSCKECIYYHTEAAKVNGASSDEIRETLAMASLTRMMSTVLNGNQINEKKFKSEAQQIMRYVKSQMQKKVSLNNETVVVKH